MRRTMMHDGGPCQQVCIIMSEASVTPIPQKRKRGPRVKSATPALIAQLVAELPPQGATFHAEAREDFIDRLGIAFRFCYGKA